MIINLSLTNWMSHKKTDLDFSDGLNLLFGENGVGKSSILHAIQFAIFGTSPIKGGKINEMIRAGCDTAEIKMDFSVFGKEKVYRIERKIFSEDTSEAHLYCLTDQKENNNGVTGPRNLNNEMRDLLGLQLTLSQNLFFLKEGEVGHYLASTPKEREEQFYEILRLDRVEDIRKTVVNLKNKEKRDYTNLEKQFDTYNSRLEKVGKKNIDLFNRGVGQVDVAPNY
ncbi:MAG: AAA family ATPase [Candidatus Odinarchaeota archaeon]